MGDAMRHTIRSVARTWAAVVGGRRMHVVAGMKPQDRGGLEAQDDYRECD